jgi:hypothetical protein
MRTAEATIFKEELKVLVAYESMKKPPSKFLFHKDYSPLNLCIMTLAPRA